MIISVKKTETMRMLTLVVCEGKCIVRFSGQGAVRPRRDKVRSIQFGEGRREIEEDVMGKRRRASLGKGEGIYCCLWLPVRRPS